MLSFAHQLFYWKCPKGLCFAYLPGLWIRIRLDPHSISLLDPDPGGKS